MEKKEHNGPNFHYLISYRKHEKEFHNSEEKPPEFTKRIMSDWRLNEIVVYQQPIYKAYEIYVEAVNNEGTAVEKPHSVIGFSSQDGEFGFCFNQNEKKLRIFYRLINMSKN